MNEVVTSAEMQMLPDYQERFLKDLLANIFRTEERQAIDPETGELMVDEAGNPVMETYAAGLAADSPLFGTPQFEQKIDPETGEPMVDARGDPIYDETKPIYETDAEGNIKYDIRGNPIQAVVGGVPRPEYMPFTDTTMEAFDMALGKGAYEGQGGIGIYKNMLDSGEATMGLGVDSLKSGYEFDPVTGEMTGAKAYDPESYKQFYDPYVEQVIDTTLADIQRSGDLNKQKLRDQATKAGAFGGSRALLAEMESQRNIDDQKARTGAQLRSAAYTGAQQQAQGAFENQMARGQTGSQLFQGLGTAQAGIGQLAANLMGTDINTMLNLGGMEQKQMQGEYDTQRKAAYEEAMEPYGRFTFMRNILEGIPTTTSAVGFGPAPETNDVADVIGGAMGLDAYRATGSSIL